MCNRPKIFDDANDHAGRGTGTFTCRDSHGSAVEAVQDRRQGGFGFLRPAGLYRNMESRAGDVT